MALRLRSQLALTPLSATSFAMSGEIMNKQDILLLYQYNQWTTAKILNAASNVTQEQFLAPGSFPHGGLRGTLVHTLFAEWIWRNRWEGISPNYRLKPEDFPTFESLRERWAEEESRLMAFVDRSPMRNSMAGSLIRIQAAGLSKEFCGRPWHISSIMEPSTRLKLPRCSLTLVIRRAIST